MPTPFLLALALIQGPSSASVLPADAMRGDGPEFVFATEPVLASRAPVRARPISLRLASTDAWGCASDSAYYCRHPTAVVSQWTPLPPPTLDPCPWTGQCIAPFPSGSNFNAGRLVAWEWRWGPIMEFMETSRGLIDGKPIMEARAREAAARNASRSSRRTPVSVPASSGGSRSPPTQVYSPPTQVYSRPPAAARSVPSGGRGSGNALP
jgi:hypothetical protein